MKVETKLTRKAQYSSDINVGHWSKEEDAKLKKLVYKDGARRWRTIASKMGTRDAKQCRERFCGHLDEKINKDQLSPEEDLLVIHYRSQGFGWANIAKLLKNGRTPNHVKNNYNQRLAKGLSVSRPSRNHGLVGNDATISRSVMNKTSDSEKISEIYMRNDTFKTSISKTSYETSFVKTETFDTSKTSETSEIPKTRNPLVSRQLTLEFILN
ncbi:12545_t:CDS:2 [Funneliformis mosseae]|uniref:12545_t:CDS:1 n=1 Tax=Funneliformis mosseae TaxID=27381 RepID=A0A9N8V1F8_FUNMO|nr:12545_t:CDS:2 [Funneliformis mosseae]